MNRNRMLFLAVVAILLSGVIAFLAYRMLKTRLGATEETMQIVVAADKLNLGTRLAAQHLRLASWPANAPLEGRFTDPKQVIGRGVVVPLSANEPILESKLAPKEAGAGLTSAIPEGMRAVSVKVDNVTGVAGFVVPGTRVDLIAVGTPNTGAGGNNEEVSKIFLENVEVLAAGQSVERDAQGKPLKNVQVVTLLVTPEDAQKLALASSETRLRLALRNPLDQEHASPVASRKSEIYGGASSVAPSTAENSPKPRVVRYVPRRVQSKPASVAPAVTAPAPPPRATFEVELIKGDKRETRTFEKQGSPQ